MLLPNSHAAGAQYATMATASSYLSGVCRIGQGDPIETIGKHSSLQ
jgi:hypothetical protein